MFRQFRLVFALDAFEVFIKIIQVLLILNILSTNALLPDKRKY